MHHPPVVRFLVPASSWPRRLYVVAGLLALVQVLWFVSLNSKPIWQMALMGVNLLAATFFSWWCLPRSTNGVLHWDGAQWQWSGCLGAPCALKRHLDFQSLMLVSLNVGSGRRIWLWLQRAQDPRQWLALRRAVAHATPLESSQHRANGSLVSPRTTP